MLTEAQILRYSRQILLKDVGGKGQERLLRSAVRVVGEGTAVQTAVSYLAAAGLGVELPERSVGAGEEGFLARKADVGSALSAVRTTISDLNPDALGGLDDPAVLASARAYVFDPAPAFALGFRGGLGVILWRTRAGCARCFELNRSGLSDGTADAHSVALGTLAALCVERVVLGLGEPAATGGVTLAEDGRTELLTLELCAEHR